MRAPRAYTSPLQDLAFNKNATHSWKTRQNKTKQNKTKQNKTKQNKTKQNKTKQSFHRMPRFVGHLWQVLSCCPEENLDCRMNLRLKRPSFVSSAETSRVRCSRSNRRRSRKLDSRSPLCYRHLGRSTDGSPRHSRPWKDLLKTTSCTSDWQSWPAEKAKQLRIDIQQTCTYSFIAAILRLSCHNPHI